MSSRVLKRAPTLSTVLNVTKVFVGCIQCDSLHLNRFGVTMTLWRYKIFDIVFISIYIVFLSLLEHSYWMGLNLNILAKRDNFHLYLKKKKTSCHFASHIIISFNNLSDCQKSMLYSNFQRINTITDRLCLYIYGRLLFVSRHVNYHIRMYLYMCECQTTHDGNIFRYYYSIRNQSLNQ